MVPFLVIGFGAFLLLWGAVKDQHPLAAVIERLGGTPPQWGPAPNPNASSGTTGGEGFTGNVAANVLRGATINSYVQSHWPTARYAGMCACRRVRGSAAGGSHAWSSHAWCGAVDYFPASTEQRTEIERWAKGPGKALGIQVVIFDESPGDLHLQYIPNPPPGAVPACSATGGFS